MKVPVIMPQMGQSVAEGTITRWLKKPGDAIAADEVIAEIESDKISIEVESPVAGSMGQCLKKEGEMAAVGEVIGMIETEGEPEDASEATANRPHHGGSESEQVLVSARASENLATELNLPDITSAWLSPYVMRLALQNNVSLAELQDIKGTGRQGRLTRNDILQYLARRPVQAGGHVAVESHIMDSGLASAGEVVPMTSIRRTIADHMVQSIRTSAHVTMVHAVDMSSIVRLRNLVQDEFLATHQLKLSFTAVILYVTARVLREFPMINASVSGTNIILRKDINIGCAVALPDESLVVPVVKQADQRSLPEIALELDRLIKLARSKSLGRDDIEGGTFSISNFGRQSSLATKSSFTTRCTSVLPSTTASSTARWAAASSTRFRDKPRR
jgi:2-oxoglutarate dehydrogenase E2 component (dihydrolipoamide succinyltransferase)